MENLDTGQPTEDGRPTELEQLQVKCLRLENKVKTLKEVSSIRKTLMELREREAKELIGKLATFEETLNTERQTRWDLSAKLKSAESDCKKVNSKLGDSEVALSQAKTLYESKLRSLAGKLDEAAESIRILTRERDLKNEKLIRTVANFESCKDDLLEKIRLCEEQKETDDLTVQASLTELIELKTALEMSLEDNLRLRSSSWGQEVQDDVTLTEVDPAIPIQDVVSGPAQSVIGDMNDFIDRLDIDEDVVLIPEHNETCYVKVHGQDGDDPRVVLSLSKTFMQIQDLILEKKWLQNEIHGMKVLGKKLESKVDRQSRRLYLVTLELGKTWKLVSKFRSQFGQLHTSKSVHRYELQQKRRCVEKLKEELGSSRQKWMSLREKNCASQLELNSLRDEFARRRAERRTESRESAFFEDSSSSLDTSSEIVDIEEDIQPQNDSTSDLDEDQGCANISYEDLVNRRAQRLLELEEECRVLFTKLESSRIRNTELASKLARLHDHYGSADEDLQSEDSALEGDESGLLSEASGDTAYGTSGISDEIAPIDENLATLDHHHEDLTSISAQAQLHYSANPILSDAPSDLEARSTLSVHTLSKIIIQQLPKCWAVLKDQNVSLQLALSNASRAMKGVEIELEEQRRQFGTSREHEMELRSELDLKQRLIKELTTKIQIAAENYRAINAEHGQMSEYIQIKLLDARIEEQRKVVKMRNLKQCSKCTKKFTLFKRKLHCGICGHGFCTDCVLQLTARCERDKTKKPICCPCFERKRKLNLVVPESFKNLQ